jgi:type IV pilus assembly protein PilP
MSSFSVQRKLLLCLSIALALACEDDAPVSVERGSGSGGGAAKPAAAAKGDEKKGDAADAAGGGVALGALVFKDEDFVEAERNRDPFRSFTSVFTPGKGPEAIGGDPQRPVIMPTTTAESMKLIAVISGLPRPKAMLLDTMGVGYVVERGDYVGRPKVIQAAGNVQMVLNWRVDRIRENEVVLTMPNPADPNQVPTTRIIAMSDQKP